MAVFNWNFLFCSIVCLIWIGAFLNVMPMNMGRPRSYFKILWVFIALMFFAPAWLMGGGYWIVGKDGLFMSLVFLIPAFVLLWTACRFAKRHLRKNQLSTNEQCLKEEQESIRRFCQELHDAAGKNEILLFYPQGSQADLLKAIQDKFSHLKLIHRSFETKDSSAVMTPQISAEIHSVIQKQKIGGIVVCIDLFSEKHILKEIKLLDVPLNMPLFIFQEFTYACDTNRSRPTLGNQFLKKVQASANCHFACVLLKNMVFRDGTWYRTAVKSLIFSREGKKTLNSRPDTARKEEAQP